MLYLNIFPSNTLAASISTNPCFREGFSNVMTSLRWQFFYWYMCLPVRCLRLMKIRSGKKILRFNICRYVRVYGLRVVVLYIVFCKCADIDLQCIQSIWLSLIVNMYRHRTLNDGRYLSGHRSSYQYVYLTYITSREGFTLFVGRTVFKEIERLTYQNRHLCILFLWYHWI